MNDRVFRCAIVAGGDGFRRAAEAAAAAAELVLDPPVGLVLVRVDGPDIRQSLTDMDPDVVLIHLENLQPAQAEIAAATAEAPGRQVLVVGPAADPEAMLRLLRAGAAEYLAEPVDPIDFAAALTRTVRRLCWAQQREAREPGRVVAVFSPKGGTGVSVVAVNLALEIRRLSARRTLLLDLDLELGTAASLMGMRPRYGPMDLVTHYSRMDEGLLASLMEVDDGGLEVLSAPITPDSGERLSREQVRTVLGFLRRHYEWVVLDVPRALSPAAIGGLESADHVLVVTTPDLPALRNVKRVFPLMDRLIAGDGGKLQVLLNGCTTSDEVTAADVKEALGKPVRRSLPFDDEVRRSVNLSRPAVSGGSRFAREIRSLAAELVGAVAMNGRAPKKNGRGRLFGGLHARLSRAEKRPGHD